MLYTNNMEQIRSEQLRGFFVGWPNPPSEEKHFELLKGSRYIWLAIDETTNQVVGFINAISDGVLSAYIPLLEVLPAYQKQGIAKELVNRMLDTLKNYYMVDLLCDDDMIPFYDKFHKIEDDEVNCRIVMHRAAGMITRNYNTQNGI